MRPLLCALALFATLAPARSALAGPPKPGKCAVAFSAEVPSGEAWILGGLALALVARGRSRRAAGRGGAGEGPA